MSREWEKKKKMFSDLMSAEDNRVADEGDILHFLKERRTHALSVILRYDAPDLLLKCHLTYSVAS